jgi:hypothetical protein
MRRLVKTIWRPNGKACIYFYQRADGSFEFCGQSEQEDDGTVFWAPSDFSGIYDSLETAEREANALVSWLKEQNSN